ncbi:1-deoxy-D-xylulose-5-phosphate reductoisomerase [Acidihalobacter ferrooxydans]|uniref:1-deoxy-D-xylulose 5-phosphate reductoisomerase n=1 Tax=Acidihalobacter ferrooxydans TaxID=1765967 RepID=A0A1P8UHB1_9GAMM|nr:1-deoxy-D-xylulose-5-phosphate reductoisomerase [Acidihalobacter ferrooxydans]APZ43233.1 1-deoxy-D-xylulose-5-phosphate reductoisomerase [Acidihalobacter ferrooxydans]
MKQQNVVVLGATGSIGASTLDVVTRHPGRFRVLGLSAHRDVDRLVALCATHHPAYVAIADASLTSELQTKLAAAGVAAHVLSGAAGLVELASLPEADAVMAAIVGAAGLQPTLAAARGGKRILLANKESLVMAGPLFMREVHDHGATLLPIDSEHNAVFQCMPSDFARGLSAVGVSRVLLTASGGPFRDFPAEHLDSVTPDQACAHPNWSMGRKISVDSATLMNKGLEVIEARWLFDASPESIEVVVHPQSVIHSLVAYTDGSVLAQLGNPDMRTPIAHAMAWPERIDSGVEPLDLFQVARLDFRPADRQRFPCLRLAYDALAAGGTATAVLNAANEVAVAAFLDGEVRFTAIPHVIEATLEALGTASADDLETVIEWDSEARTYATEWLTGHAGKQHRP